MSVSCEMLLHPELLSNEQLICIIQERHLHVPNIEHMRRDELLELFHHYCVPYGQRKYRDSGRGKLLNRNRHLSPDPTNRFDTITSSKPKSNPECDRLKPPDLLSGHMKRIRIEANTYLPPKYNDTLKIVKRKMSIDTVFSPAETPTPKKEKKHITWP